MSPGNVVQVSVGAAHSCWRDVAGNVSCFGDNSLGQLGVDAPSSPVPAAVTLPAKATFVDVNYGHSCAVLETGELYCWGENIETQLGQGDAPDMNRSAPVRVGTFTNVARVGCGQGHTVALLESGELYSWGRNSSGEAGLGEGLPDRIRVPTLIPIDDTFRQLDAGQDSTCALDEAGKIFCWGDGEGLHLGNGSLDTAWSPLALNAVERFTQVATETFHSCAIDQQSVLRCWGRGYEGQLGLGDNRESQATPEAVKGSESWLEVSAGRFHTCAATRDQRVLCSGDNELGQLGQRDTSDRNVLVGVPLPE
jgi:alpha-tubulin suppressor-like RCC1 family protein